jgi:hypothetical protein
MDNKEYARFDRHSFASKHHIRVPQIKIIDNGVYFCRSDKCEDKDSWDGYIPDDSYIIIENDNPTTYWPNKKNK